MSSDSNTQHKLAYTYGGDPGATPKSLWEWFTKQARANPEGIALIATHQAADHLSNLVSQPESQVEKYLSWSYGQLLSAVEKLASFCTKHNLAANDTFVALVDNSNAAEWTLLFWTASQQELQTASASLKFILSSSDTIDREIVHKATQMFPPSRTRFFPTFGMSEGPPLFGFVDEEKDIYQFNEDSGVVGLGRALPGTRVKVCDQSDAARRPLARGERGALHISSIALISHYLDNRSEEDFYEDEHGHRWFKSGDEAIMDDTGVIYVVGRTKDTIIHNGQNILPIVSEGCLMEGFGVDAVVVGLKHKLAGSVAAAVVKNVLDDATKRKMADYVLQKQGPDRGLDGGVWSLQDLGMDDWPVNPSGKIQKSELVEALTEKSTT